MKTCLQAAALIAILSLGRPAMAWDNFVAHESLAEEGLTEARGDPQLARYLHEVLGVPNGIQSPLALQLGFDPTGVDPDLQPETPESQAPDPQNCTPSERSWEGSRLTDNLNKGREELDPGLPRRPAWSVGSAGACVAERVACRVVACGNAG